MNLQELALRTEIPIRRLRHCVDEGLVPGFDIESGLNEVGRRRSFHEDVGFAICCAATLVRAGIDRSTVRVFLGGLAKVTFPKTNQLLLAAFLEKHAMGTAELGDNVYIRFSVTKPLTYVSPWIDPETRALLRSATAPLTTIGLNIGAIRQRVFKF